MTAERFTAWAMCPHCKMVDLHKIRPPKPAPSADVIEAWERNVSRFNVVGFTGQVIRVIEHPPRPVDESVFETIRICRCGYEWGMV